MYIKLCVKVILILRRNNFEEIVSKTSYIFSEMCLLSRLQLHVLWCKSTVKMMVLQHILKDAQESHFLFLLVLYVA